ncbi:MAG TPA: recombinase family protein [Noviherbaspirillum sp.]|jgi:DNA invertase Pin-like site-specific DNA recombinase|uniref:recombinase family protein n=1 Tax=Noviherbaspirillum sp. TaxID=1926288 RepID=UPI002F930B8C
MQTILYARVSTVDQTIDHQKSQAEAAGFKLDRVITDDGVSGISTKLQDRSGGRRLFDILRPGDTLVVRWVDRLGRNYQDVTDTIREFMRRGVILRTVINAMTFDGSTQDPVQQAVRDALIAFMAATAQAQAEATKEAQKAGIAHAKLKDDKYLGRKPSYSLEQIQAVQEMTGKSVTEIAKVAGLSRQTVYRIQADPAAAVKALEVWSTPS